MYRILIVEDDAAIAAALARHLTSWGFEPRVCEDFSRVKETFFAFDPHLTLMDLALPISDGYSLCQQTGAYRRHLSSSCPAQGITSTSSPP